MTKRENDNQSLGDALKQFVKHHKLQKGLNKVQVRDAWEELMGKGVANYTKSVTLEGATLVVRLTSSVLREELSYGKEKIITMMNESLGSELINKLELR